MGNRELRTSNGEKRTVLVVDDEEDLLEIIGDEMEHMGLRCLRASSVNEAIEKLKANRVDVVVSDIRMPERPGTDLFHAVSDIDPKDRPNFLFITGFADLEPSEAYDIGSDGFFHKPFRLEQLVDAIQNLLEPRSWNWSKPFIHPTDFDETNRLEREMISYKSATAKG
jgi:Response regulator containing CheY-like receiver, AAA-type ATPase, and DNA-binding domains